MFGGPYIDNEKGESVPGGSIPQPSASMPSGTMPSGNVPSRTMPPTPLTSVVGRGESVAGDSVGVPSQLPVARSDHGFELACRLPEAYRRLALLIRVHGSKKMQQVDLHVLALQEHFDAWKANAQLNLVNGALDDGVPSVVEVYTMIVRRRRRQARLWFEGWRRALAIHQAEAANASPSKSAKRRMKQANAR